MPAPGLVPLGKVGGSVPALNDLTPAQSCIVGAEGYFPLFRAIGYHTHFRTPEIIGPEILKPHPLDTKNAPFFIFGSSLHAIIPVAVGFFRIRPKQIHYLRYGESPGSVLGSVVPQYGENELSFDQFLPSCRIRYYGHIPNELLVIEQLEQRNPFAGPTVYDQEAEHAAIGVAVARTPAP